MNLFERNAKKIVAMSVVAASFSPIFARLINASPMAIGFYRLTFALPFFLITTLIFYRKELFSLDLKKIAECALAGLFLACHFFTLYTALEYTTVASTVVLCSIHPIIILLITTLIYRERTSNRAIIGVLTAFFGAAIISGGDYSFVGNAIFGDFMAILGALFMGLYLLSGRKMRKDINAAVYVSLVFFTCWLAFGIGMFATGTPFAGYSAMDYFWLFMMSMMCQIGAHAVFNWCLGHVSPLYISTVETGEAIFASALAAILFYEIPTIWQLIGGAITIVGLLYYNYYDAQNQDDISK